MILPSLMQRIEFFTGAYAMKSFITGLVIAASFLSATTGCVHASLSFTDALIPKRCVNSDIHLRRCDPQSDPLRCQAVKFSYVRGCEAIEVKSASKEEKAR